MKARKQTVRKRERRGDASDRSYGSLVVQEKKPSCKDRVGKWELFLVGPQKPQLCKCREDDRNPGPSS